MAASTRRPRWRPSSRRRLGQGWRKKQQSWPSCRPARLRWPRNFVTSSKGYRCGLARPRRRGSRWMTSANS
eukprot:11627256-Alexandrium_andersonii.AAC.1